MPFLSMRGGRIVPNAEQIRNKAGVEEIKVEQVEGQEDARYDAMTDAQREAYYVNPSLWTRLRKKARGRDAPGGRVARRRRRGPRRQAFLLRAGPAVRRRPRRAVGPGGVA